MVAPGELGRTGVYAGKYMVDAAYAQLVGVCRGILADHQLADDEIRFLDEWLEQHQPQLPEWPTRALVERVKRILSDGVITEDERVDLMAFLVQLAPRSESANAAPASTALPFTHPEPEIVYPSHGFCITGTFLFGKRRDVEAAITSCRGSIESVAKADYLIVGATVTPAWKYGTHGLKIEAAVARRERGDAIAIIGEQYWRSSLQSRESPFGTGQGTDVP